MVRIIIFNKPSNKNLQIMILEHSYREVMKGPSNEKTAPINRSYNPKINIDRATVSVDFFNILLLFKF